jgi:hypothetical protein
MWDDHMNLIHFNFKGHFTCGPIYDLPFVSFKSIDSCIIYRNFVIRMSHLREDYHLVC